MQPPAPSGGYTHLAIAPTPARNRKEAFERLHREARGFLYGNAQAAHREHVDAVRGVEAQLHLRLDLLLVRHLRVVHEGSAARVGRLVARRGVLEAFDYGGLSAAVVAHDDRDGREELDDRYLLIIERAYAADS